MDAFYADPSREVSSLDRAEMSHCSLALGQIGDIASLPQVQRVCKDMAWRLDEAHQKKDYAERLTAAKDW